MGQAGTGIEGLDDVLGGGFGSMRTCSRACCIPPTWSSARRRSASLRRSRRRSRSGWCSTAFRSQILSLKHYFAITGATVLLLDDLTAEPNDKTVHSIAHGVVRLEETAPEYGSERRRLRGTKYRGRR